MDIHSVAPTDTLAALLSVSCFTETALRTTAVTRLYRDNLDANVLFNTSTSPATLQSRTTLILQLQRCFRRTVATSFGTFATVFLLVMSKRALTQRVDYQLRSSGAFHFITAPSPLYCCLLAIPVG